MTYKCLKLKLRVFLAGHIVAMVTYCATKLTATYSPMIGQLVDTMILASTDKDVVIMIHQTVRLGKYCKLFPSTLSKFIFTFSARQRDSMESMDQTDHLSLFKEKNCLIFTNLTPTRRDCLYNLKMYHLLTCLQKILLRYTAICKWLDVGDRAPVNDKHKVLISYLSH